MRFIHITDTHISASLDFTNYGHSPLKSLELVVDTINNRDFDADFVLHTGDVIEDRSEQAYRNAKPILDRINLPVYYCVGNHDDADNMRKALLGQPADGSRYDYSFEVGGIRFVVLDSRGPNDPAGQLEPQQIASLRAACAPDGPPMVIVLHHPPVALDSVWMDKGWKIPHMLLENSEQFMDAIAPARERIRGVFFGHIHRNFQVLREGILMCGGASTFAQLGSWPDQAAPSHVPHEPGTISVVTVTSDQTTIRQYALPRS